MEKSHIITVHSTGFPNPLTHERMISVIDYITLSCQYGMTIDEIEADILEMLEDVHEAWIEISRRKVIHPTIAHGI